MATGNAEQILRDNREFYRACAPAYDAGRRYSYRREQVRVGADLEWLARHCGLAGGTVVDIGCGTGFYGLMAAAAGAAEVHCLDIDPVFLEAARAKIQGQFPQVEVRGHEGDLEAFIGGCAPLLPHVDLFLMGGVIQYVPGHEEVLARLARVAGGACFYITSTLIPGGGRYPLIEGVLARLDYLVHRLVHPRSGGQRVLPATKVTLPVDPARLARLFGDYGFATRCVSYSSFHTLIFDRLHRALRYLVPSLGSRFTLIAVGPTTEPGAEERN